MAKVYAQLIIQGKKTLEDVPEKPEGFKEEVLAILEDYGYSVD